jgi:LemA protein
MSRAVNIINALYGEELHSKRSLGERLLGIRKRPPIEIRGPYNKSIALYRERRRLITRARLVILIAIGLLATLVLVGILYFNSLTLREQDVYMELAKIETLLQRRRNISTNLARIVKDYALHERAIFDHVSDTRGRAETDRGNGAEAAPAMGAPSEETAPSSPAPPGAPRTDKLLDDVVSMLEGKGPSGVPFDSKLAGLMAVAESYPDLKLSESFHQFMESLIETEKDLSDQRMQYSDVVNTYTTQLKRVPGNIFAFVFGFEPFPYFMADEDAKRFTPVDF